VVLRVKVDPRVGFFFDPPIEGQEERT